MAVTPCAIGVERRGNVRILKPREGDMLSQADGRAIEGNYGNSGDGVDGAHVGLGVP